MTQTNETLYMNNEKFGSTSYIGTWDQWKTGMENSFREWYADYENTLSDKLYHQEIDAEDSNPIPYEQWVEETMDECLSAATDEDVANYERLSTEQL